MDDRWGRPDDHWEVSDWYRIPFQKWAQFDFFQTPIQTTNVRIMTVLIEEKLALAGSTLWQFNLETRRSSRARCGDWVRWTLAMEEPRMVIWTRADCYIRRPFWLAVAWLKNNWTRLTVEDRCD